MRVSSEKESAGSDGSTGWIHVIGEPFDSLEPAREYKQPQKADIASLYALYASKSRNMSIESLSSSWGLSEAPVASLGVVWIGSHQAYGIPMRNERGKVIGIQLRTTESKWTIRGSELGIFCNWPILSKRVFVCEGASDTAAMISLGFEAVGRANCGTGFPILQKMLADREVVIVSDNDPPTLMPNGKWVTPGQDGAILLAEKLKGHVNSVKIITPVAPFKDARAWINSGVSRDTIEAAARVAYEI